MVLLKWVGSYASFPLRRSVNKVNNAFSSPGRNELKLIVAQKLKQKNFNPSICDLEKDILVIIMSTLAP